MILPKKVCLIFWQSKIPDDVQKAINDAVQKFGGLHGVINCAGIAAAKTVSVKDDNGIDLQ